MKESPSEETIRYLESLGAPRSTFPDNPEELGGLAFDLAFGRDAEYTMHEVAAAAGLDFATVHQTYRTMGVTTDPDATMFTSGDVELVRMLTASVEGPLEDEEGGQILRVAARALTAIAEAAVAEVRQGVESRHQTIDDAVLQSAQMGELAIELSRGLGVAFRHHLRLAAERQRIGQQDVAERELIRVAIGFIDMSGFTGLASRLPVDELVELVNMLERRSSELATGRDVRIVKMIGDRGDVRRSRASSCL